MILFPDDRTGPAIYDAARERWWSFQALRREVEKLAELLRFPQKGVVFCFCRNDFASVAAYLACLEVGHAVALLDEGMASEFKARLISQYAPDFIVSSVETAIPDFRYQASLAGPHNYIWRGKPNPGELIHEELALMLSTSGSTGSPKFVRLTRNNILSNAESICRALEISPGDRAISSLPLHYSYGLSVLHTHLLAGATLVLTGDGLATSRFWEVFRRTECISFAGVPHSYEVLNRLGLDNLNVPSLRVMTLSGGKLSDELIARFHNIMASRGGRYYAMYGQTEATARIAVLSPENLPAKLGSAGRVIPGGSLAIEDGELVYSGPNVMMGYALSRDDLPLGDVLGGCLHTGDLASLDPEGFLFITGRRKRDAKLFGLRLNLDEIETMLRVNGPTAVVGTPDKLMIYCEYGDAEAFARYRQDLAAKLKLNHRALEFHRIQRLPVNANGKIDYRDLAGCA